MNVYNILWADDDLHNILDDFNIEDALSENHINVIGKALNADDLEKLLANTHSQVHAVIVDANMDAYKYRVNDERNTSGLTAVLGLVKLYWNKYHIPFYLYTGRSRTDLLKKYPDDELRYFKQPGHWFEKFGEEYKRLFKQITNDIDNINSPTFQLYNKYQKEFEAASYIEDATRLLEKGLMYRYSSDWKDTQDYFNPARKILERIFDKLREQKILPPINSLNSMYKLLSKQQYEDDNCKYELKKELMPKALVHSLKYFLDITQDGSHSSGDLTLSVDKYIRSSQNSNLYNSVLFIAMDLLLWYMDVSKIDYRSEDIWNGGLNYVYIGKLCMSADGRYWYTGEYELIYDKAFADGVKIGIKKSIPNNKPKPGIDKFVPKGCYVILDNE